MTRDPHRVLEPPPSLPPAPPGVPRRPRPPPVSVAFIAVSVAVWLAQMLTRGALTQKLVLYGPAVQAGEYWRVFTSALAHSDETPLHIVFNMLAVSSLGFPLERGIGPWRFLGVSLVGCFGAAAAALFGKFEVPMLGLSGVILAWAGALLPLLPREGRRQLAFGLVQVAILSLLPFISGAAHLGGFLAGLACGGVLRLGAPAFRRALPFLVFIAATAALAAAHPERFHP